VECAARPSVFTANVPVVFAAIPSPSTNSIGPFTFYGLAIALGVVAAVTLSQRRWSARGGNDDDISAIALWGVPAGVIGARIYHIVTDWQNFSGEGFWKLFAIREGGLGIPGGMFLGLLVGLWVARRRDIDLPRVLDAVVPALPLAQAIGRWGNYFNQELYGRTTDLPWGLEIDRDHAPSEFRDPDVLLPNFHPTFLYESLWNLSLVGLILWIDKKGLLPTGRLIAVYLTGYGIGRWWVESLRIDPANEVAGLRVNIWMSIVLVVSGLLLAFWRRDSSSVDEPVSTT
jgi:prolipoprotein diacylglyceryl transferase